MANYHEEDMAKLAEAWRIAKFSNESEKVEQARQEIVDNLPDLLTEVVALRSELRRWHAESVLEAMSKKPGLPEGDALSELMKKMGQWKPNPTTCPNCGTTGQVSGTTTTTPYFGVNS